MPLRRAVERRDRFCPHRQQRRLVRTEIFLEFRIEGDVVRVVQEQVELYFFVSRTGKKCGVERVGFGCYESFILDAMDVLPLGGFGLQEIAQSSTVLGGRFPPVFLDRIPSLAEALFISVPILGDDGGDAFGMQQRNSQSHWCAVIENVDCKALQANCLREIGDYFGQVFKRVAKPLAVGSIGKAKTREVGRDDMESGWEAGRTIRNRTINELNGLMGMHPMLTRLMKNGTAYSTALWFAVRKPADLFAPLAHSAATLFLTGNRKRVRKCANCVLHFHDTSKKGIRRWCSMQLCGNRFKVAAYAAQQRKNR